MKHLRSNPPMVVSTDLRSWCHKGMFCWYWTLLVCRVWYVYKYVLLLLLFLFMWWIQNFYLLPIMLVLFWFSVRKGILIFSNAFQGLWQRALRILLKYHFLLQCMKVKREIEVAQSCLTPSDPMDCSPPGSSVHGLFQARALEWWEGDRQEGQGSPGGERRLQVPDIFISLKRPEETNQRYVFFSVQI